MHAPAQTPTDFNAGEFNRQPGKYYAVPIGGGRYAFEPRITNVRTYHAARISRTTADWLVSQATADQEIRSALPLLINRCRSLERDNDYARGFLGDCEQNVLGTHDVDLRMKCGDWRGENFVLDQKANREITDAWKEWCKKENCTVSKLDTWHDVKRLALRGTVRDGTFLWQERYGSAARNRFGYALRLLEIDQLDLHKFQTLQNGGEIRFGIETDADGAVVAFHMYVRHPGDVTGHSGGNVERIPAESMRHLYLRERTTQTVGVPWFVSAITRLRQLGAYEEAELIAARLCASKMGFFTREKDAAGEPYRGDGVDAAGNVLTDAEPGALEELPTGMQFTPWDPTHPNADMPEFRKAMLRGIAAGLGTSYVTIGNDLEAVNFSSARVGLLDEREMWKAMQFWFRNHFREPVFGRWLYFSLSSGAIALPIAKFEKFNHPHFKSRSWAWIDPQKEIAASVAAIDNMLTSRRSVIEEAGGDVEDVANELAADAELFGSKGLKPKTLSGPPPPQVAPAGESSEDLRGMTPCEFLDLLPPAGLSRLRSSLQNEEGGESILADHWPSVLGDTECVRRLQELRAAKSPSEKLCAAVPIVSALRAFAADAERAD